ncbi:hypothetical protein TRP8649_04427 [Pelagimonas phthalicica]|uniref:Uncharacterized protein n=1 Tax=Pelagimonas phthalicica TaxID=1037362 RepID=A0A238JJA9_9RHOB|nr:hypothetical protein [Pelagimonas phthalicica]TDS90116.1 hypothetical protein CLV87_4173 [Pelagimonas phthalicica]SMX30284.1 hypothetical protein TRP8649_04427 [Pelagimonas phthalicica]
MKHLILTTLLLTAPLAAQAHHGPDLTTADLLGATPVSFAVPQPSPAPALSQTTPVAKPVLTAGS